MPLKTTITTNTSSGAVLATVALEGSLDTATSPQLEKDLAPHLASAAVTTLVFDLAKLSFLSSAGIRVLMIARKAIYGRQGHVLIVNMQPQIRKVFEIVKAMDGLSIFKDVAELDVYLAKVQANSAPKSGT